MAPSNDPLDPLLERLRASTPAPPGSVRGEVWRRIANGEVPATSLSFLDRVELAFSRPAFAVSFVSACLLAGLFFAEMRVSRLQARQSVAVELHYLQLIDPLIDETTLPSDPAP